MDLLDRLLGHDHWATACLLDLSRGLPDAQLDQPFDVGHRTLRTTFEHMIFVHVVLHDAEHRSEALHILERLGVPDLPEVDHGLWDQTARGA